MNSWGPQDVTVVLVGLTSVIAALATAAVKIIFALKGVEHKVDALEVKVDGRLTQLLARTASDERSKGVEAGRGEMIVPVSAMPVPIFDGEKLVVPIPVPVPPVLLVPQERKEGKS